MHGYCLPSACRWHRVLRYHRPPKMQTVGIGVGTYTYLYDPQTISVLDVLVVCRTKSVRDKSRKQLVRAHFRMVRCKGTGCKSEPVPGKTKCTACSAKYSKARAEREQQHRAEAIAAGYVKCSRCSIPAVEGKSRCQSCLNKRKAPGSADKRYDTSAKGIVASAKKQKKYNGSAKDKARKDRANAKLKIDRKETDLFHRLRLKSCCANVAAGRIQDSAVFGAATEFGSNAEFRTHLAETWKEWDIEMNWENYGVVWNIDHRIPAEAYDHSIPENIDRCWSKANMRACPPAINGAKKDKVLKSQCDIVGSRFFPVEWGGEVPRSAE